MSLTQPAAQFQEAAVLIQQAGGDWNQYGEWEPGAASRTPIQVETYPASAGAVRQVVPEGARLQDWRTFLVYNRDVAPLRAGDDPTDADLIEHGGQTYRVRSVRDYRPDGPAEVLAIRQDG